MWNNSLGTRYCVRLASAQAAPCALVCLGRSPPAKSGGAVRVRTLSYTEKLFMYIHRILLF